MTGIRSTEPGDVAGSSGVWIVTLVRAQFLCSARFRDTAYPTPALALQAAQAFRDAIQARLPNRRIGLLGSAVAGDMAFVRRAVFGGKASWMIRMMIDGKLRAKLFSVRKYGEDDARRRALELRPAWLIEAGLGEQPLPTKSDIAQIESNIRRDFGEQIPSKPKRGYNEAPMYGITRSDANAVGQDGVWTVMIMRRKVRHGGRFADRDHGGKDATLKQAQACRDAILATVAPLSRRERAEMLLKSNTSGVTGVRMEQNKRGHPYAWVAEINFRQKTVNVVCKPGSSFGAVLLTYGDLHIKTSKTSRPRIQS